MPNDIESASTAPRSVIEHLVPKGAALENVELSIVIPALKRADNSRRIRGLV